MRSIAVYCGSSSGQDPVFLKAAAETGAFLARQGVRLVYGGGRKGLMGEVADACLAAGGEVFGVTPEAMVQSAHAHQGLTELVVVENMHQRKDAMIRAADGFIALPGGIGTLEELFEVFTWHQLGFHDKPCGVLNVQGYYDSLLTFLDEATNHGFMRRSDRDSLQVDQNIEHLFDRMCRYARQHPTKLLDA